MKALKLACIAIMLLTAASCRLSNKRVKGNGNVTTETRSVGNATKINVLGSMDVVLATGETSVKVEGDENVLNYILTEEHDGWLNIRERDNYDIQSKNNITVYITTPAISQIKVTGSGDVKSNSEFTSQDEMNFSITGSGDLTIAVNTPRLKAAIAGSGNLNASGETRDVKVSIAGSGNFNGYDLKAENADINIAGSGDASIYADVHLKANIMGSGGVHYKGNAIVDKSVMGSGTVSKDQ